MLVRKIEESELMEARNISSLCFGWIHDKQGKDMKEYIREVRENPSSKGDAFFLDTFAAFTDEGEMMSCLSVLPYEVSFNESILKMSGIGGVCTYPQHRRKGAVRELFLQAMKEMYERDVSFSYLYPFSEKFYGNFGYVPSPVCIRWSFDLKTIPNYKYDGTFHLYRGDGNYSEFNTVYQDFAGKFNMMVHRDAYDWDVLKNANPFKGKRHAYLYKDTDGKPCGYFIFEKLKEENHNILDCKEVIFDSFKTLKSIMSFAKTFSADYDKILFDAPRCLSLEYFCEDYSQSSSQRNLRQNGMVRVINVEKVLKHAIYKGTGELYIQIRDSFLEMNNRVFHILYQNGAAVEVSSFHTSSLLSVQTPDPDTSLTALEHTQKVDMEMTINQFSAAIVGFYDITDLEYLEGITLNCSTQKAAELIFKKPCWINNFF